MLHASRRYLRFTNSRYTALTRPGLTVGEWITFGAGLATTVAQATKDEYERALVFNFEEIC